MTGLWAVVNPGKVGPLIDRVETEFWWEPAQTVGGTDYSCTGSESVARA